MVKRDSSIQQFDETKIINAVLGAFEDVYGSKNVDTDIVDIITNDVLYNLESWGQTKIGIEDIQDMIEVSLMRKGYTKVAKQFILYRENRAQLRDQKHKILQTNTLDQVSKSFTINQLKVLAKRYLLRVYTKDDKEGKIVESPSQLFRRVATLMGLSDLLHDPALFDKDGVKGDWVKDYQTVTYDKYFKILDERFINQHHWDRFVNLYNQLNNEGKMNMALSFFMDNYFTKLFDLKYQAKIDQYYKLMTECIFMPNTPTLMNAGTKNGGLSACFVLDAPDSVDGYIRGTVADAAAIYKGAGGVGINWSNFRPEGSSANGVPNAASGPVSFIKLIDALTDVVKQAGKRRGANMGILDINSPDIEKFITVKTTPGVYENFNLSVGIWDDYWNALVNGKSEFQLTHFTHKERDRKVNPEKLWDLVALSAWKSAEPGVIFFDNVNKVNHMYSELGEIRATNPCGEQALYPNSSCTLGSINISKFVTESGQFNWGDFAEVVRITTRFLDNVVSMNKYPTEKIEEMALKERRIGLGIMGLADALYMMKIPYNSKEGFEFMAEICRQLTSISIDESVNLAMERGPAPLFKFETQGVDINNRRTRSSLSINQRHSDIYKYGIRNTWNTTIAPTGTIAMISGCSYGIEPEFALGYSKKVTIGEFYYSNKYLEKALREEGIYSEELVQKIVQNGGSIQSIDEIPEHIKKIFVTSMDLHWADHVMAQGICQQYIDNSISKTINLAEDVIVDDVKNAYLLAHELGCKGMTVYRNNSRKEQVLHATSDKTGKQLRPSQYTLDYIKNKIDNQYVKDKLFQFFGIDSIDRSLNDIPSYGYSLYEEFTITEVPTVTFKATSEGDKNYCATCQSKLIFQEGCKVCLNCQVSFCNV